LFFFFLCSFPFELSLALKKKRSYSYAPQPRIKMHNIAPRSPTNASASANGQRRSTRNTASANRGESKVNDRRLFSPTAFARRPSGMNTRQPTRQPTHDEIFTPNSPHQRRRMPLWRAGNLDDEAAFPSPQANGNRRRTTNASPVNTRRPPVMTPPSREERVFRTPKSPYLSRREPLWESGNRRQNQPEESPSPSVTAHPVRYAHRPALYHWEEQ